jgi:RimJ/RimL family protein N-acetyltransferase
LVVVSGDEDVPRYTRVPADPDESFVRGWIRRYELGWEDGTSAGFAVVDHAGSLLGFAAVVRLDLEAAEGEIGYVVGKEARGRGVATRAAQMLTHWSFDDLRLERLELLINPENIGSKRVAERAGYRFEGVLRSKHINNGRRADFGVWSRLRSDAAELATPGPPL